MNKIPCVDLNKFLSNNSLDKQEFVQAIGDAYENIGFVALKGHFLDDQLIDDLYNQVQRFFDLPLETKEQYEDPDVAGQRGYISFGKESAKGKTEADLKEFWHFGQFLDNDPELEAEYPKNVWVNELPEFNIVGEKVYKRLEKTAQYVLRALAIHLNLEETYFDKFIHNGNSILRPIHYPPIQKEPKAAERAAAHGDINLITLLMGAQGKGLQVQNHKGEWIDAIAEPDELMINVGDMLSRLTNNKLKSTIHRVVNPPRELWSTSRYSIPFFMHPVSSMKLNVLESCIDQNNPKLFDDITAGEFLDQRLKELGFNKK
jgi:isopenicillin N synthase-like dioxygenase